MVDKTKDQLGYQKQGDFSTGWDWKGTYVSALAEDGYERFSQFSASPDSTVLFAGPARFTGLTDDPTVLTPIGLADGLNFSSNAQLARLYEIGSNRSFFTRGKTASALSFSKMLADQQNILAALTNPAYHGAMNDLGTKAPGASSPNPNIMMNLDSEYFAVPFGLLMVFKTRGGSTEADSYGKVLSGLYLEYCMFDSYNFSVNSSSPVIVEGISLQFDRPVPVSFN